MGQCTVCGNRGSIESSIAEFIDNMNIKELSIEKFLTTIKSNLKGKKVDEPKWKMSVVDNLIGKDKAGSPHDYYINYFYDSYSNFDFNNLIFSLLLFCRKDTIILKQKMLELSRILKLNDVIIKSEDEKFTFISKEFLSGYIETYCTLISSFTIEYVCKVKSYDQSILKEMKEQYTTPKIKLFTENLLNDFCLLQNKQNSNRILDLNSNPIDLKKYLDFDLFYDEKYSLLCDDKQVRDGIYESNPKLKLI